MVVVPSAASGEREAEPSRTASLFGSCTVCAFGSMTTMGGRWWAVAGGRTVRPTVALPPSLGLSPPVTVTRKV